MTLPELQNGQFKVFIPDTNPSQLMDLVLSVSGVKPERLRLGYDWSSWGGNESVSIIGSKTKCTTSGKI